MEWHTPQFLYLILPLCVSWGVLALFSDKRRQRAREAFVAQPMWSRVLPLPSRKRFFSKLALQQLAFIAGLMGLAGPQFGTQLEQVVPRGSDLYVLIDVSRSMLAEDVPPSRLERAKTDVSALVNRLEGERVGLIAFAGQAVVKCPLTVDYDSFRRALNELDPNSAPRGGTAIGDAIRKAIEVFHAKAERDQAVLLITDGDDQESYPLEAANVAAERKVTIFTVGLGDTDQGARVPQKANSSTFMEHDGQQVWSKLDGKLLQEISIATSGVYIPAGTRSYDLGELYVNHLQGRRGDAEASQQRIRKSERFQIFLAIALIALLADLCISPYATVAAPDANSVRPSRSAGGKSASTNLVTTMSLLAAVWCSDVIAGESQNKVRDGLKLYQQEKFDAAGKEFADAAEELDKEKSVKAAVAAFDEACAWHRKGDTEKARDRYLKAGLSQDRKIATASHFNLGTMAAENARRLAGEKPDNVEPEKRQEILDELKQAVVSYRHCLELQPDHAQSRRNLELVRNWIKYYTDRWRELDRQKKRDESNLIQFLEFLMQTQTTLREAVNQLPENVPADSFAELKRAQDELREEILVLREKIATELVPKDESGGNTAQMTKEIQEGITLLQSWADAAGDRMDAAARELGKEEPTAAIAEQKNAVEELDRIWDAVIPFQPLLTQELTSQTSIARSLNPASAPATERAGPTTGDAATPAPAPTETEPQTVESAPAKPAAINLDELIELQARTLRKARLLAPKAEAELNRVESQPATDATAEIEAPAVDPNAPPDAAAPSASQQVDPEKVKAGLRKAIELAPKAVESMELAMTRLQKKEATAAAPHAEEARRILEEIQQAQPKDPQEQNQDQQQDDKNKDHEKNEDQKNDEKKDQKKNEQDKKEDEKKKDEPSEDQKKSDQKQKDEKPDDKQKQSDSKQSQDQQAPQPQVSQDRIEEALRMVRERQQQKRERDRETRARVTGRAPVDKDW